MRTRRDTIDDILLCLFIFAAGILIGSRLHELGEIYDSHPDRIAPECSAEDEWINAETLKCVHVDFIGH